MAPREAKVTTKVQRVILKSNTTKKPISITTSTVAKNTKKTTEKTPIKAKNATVPSQQKINALATPKCKENKPTANCPGSVTKSGKKSWKRRPKPAHSGVPVPEKMKRILQQQLQNSDCSF